MSLNFGPIVLGGNVFGWTVQAPEAQRLLDAYLDHGGVSIDTADVYPAWAPGAQGGDSERIIGDWMAQRGCRDKVLIATKVAKWPEQPGLSPQNIRQAVEGSLRRLKTDYIDLYYAHEDDQSVDQEAYVAAFDALVCEGKVRALGASNYSPARLSSALDIAQAQGMTGFSVSQDHWNLIERDIERELVPLLQARGIVELPYWSLASGFLTGKYRPGAQVSSARAGSARAYLEDPKNLKLLALLDELQAQHRVSITAIALAWLRAQPTVGAPIASARTVEQLEALFEQVSLTPQELEALTHQTIQS